MRTILIELGRRAAGERTDDPGEGVRNLVRWPWLRVATFRGSLLARLRLWSAALAAAERRRDGRE